MVKRGIFGGTFDPPHIAHLIVADEVFSMLNLSQIIFIPAFQPPHKDCLTSFDHRYKMVSLAIQGNPSFIISDIEKVRGGKSFSIDTIRELKKIYPNDELYFIIGQDQFLELDTWKEPEKIFEATKVCVLLRYGYEKEFKSPITFKQEPIFLKVSQLAIKSSDIRERIKNNKPFRYLLSEKVYQYIVKNKLYMEEKC